MQELNARSSLTWAPWINYAESQVNCTIEHAWKAMLDYQAWNPSFAGATVTPIRGQHRAPGEVVRIKKQVVDVKGEPLPEFYAETVKVVPNQHIAWFVFKKEGDYFRNFVDFKISPTSSGVKFDVSYYGQSQFSEDLLIEQIKSSQSTLQKLADAFKKYCEEGIGNPA